MKILFIEDDAIETMKLERTMAKFNFEHKIVNAGNGEEALKILNSGDSLPDIILLDLNMPKMNGIEFLGMLKNDMKLRYLPTIILTTSQNWSDLLKCYEIGIAGYVIKPLKFEEYENKLRRVLEYWEINELIKG